MTILTELLKMKKEEIHESSLDEPTAEKLAHIISSIYGPISLTGFKIDIKHENLNITDQLNIMWRLTDECISTTKCEIEDTTLVAFYFINYIVMAYIPSDIFKYGLLNTPLADERYIEKLIIYNVRGENI